MPRPTLVVLSARAHKPLISFIGKRIWPASSTSHPHPAAPPEYRETFPGNGAGMASIREFWDAPVRFWRPRHHELEQFEIDAIQSGGASLH